MDNEQLTKERLEELQDIYDTAMGVAILQPELRPPGFSLENCAMAMLLGAIQPDEPQKPEQRLMDNEYCLFHKERVCACIGDPPPSAVKQCEA